MIRATINGKEYLCPSNESEATLGFYESVARYASLNESEKDAAGLCACLFNVSRDEVLNSPGGATLEAVTAMVLGWLPAWMERMNALRDAKHKPKRFIFLDLGLKFDKRWDTDYTLAQRAMWQQGASKPAHSIIVYLLAVFAGGYAGHDWAKDENIEKTMSKIRRLPAEEGLVLFFFLISRPRSTSGVLRTLFAGLTAWASRRRQA